MLEKYIFYTRCFDLVVALGVHHRCVLTIILKVIHGCPTLNDKSVLAIIGNYLGQ